jgi:hypothetical protein
METSPLNLQLGVSEKPNLAKLCKTEAKRIYFLRNINPFLRHRTLLAMFHLLNCFSEEKAIGNPITVFVYEEELSLSGLF